MTHSIFGADATVDRDRSNGNRHRPHAGFGYDVDGTSYTYDQSTITGAQLRFLVGLYPRQALVRILDDGSRVTVTAAETVNLTSGAQFRRRPRFTRD
jgi:hypothetical protein